MNLKKSLPLAALLGMAPLAHGQLLFQNFDGGGANTPYALATNSGDPFTPASVVSSGGGAGGANGSVLQITTNTNSNNNSIAFDAVNIPSTGFLQLSFDFWMGADGGANASNPAADGFGIGFFPTAVYGASGANNPAAGPVGFAWERPNPAGVPALTVGIDLWDSGAGAPLDGNNVNLNWNGAELGNADPGFALNSDQWHRLTLTAIDQGSDSRLLVNITQDIYGANVTSNLIDVIGTGVDLDGIGSNYRLIGGGRTGGANHTGQIDNIAVSIPEPGVLAFLSLSGLALILRRRP